MQRVGERVPIVDRDRVAVSLDHLPAGPPALALELEEIGTRLAHEVGGPGVPQDVGAKHPDTGSGPDPLEHFLPALDRERVTRVGGEERRIVAVVAARAEIAVELAPDGGMELDRPAAAELRGLRTDRESAGREVEIVDAGLAGLIRPQSGAGEEHDECVVALSRPSGAADGLVEVVVAEGLAHVLVHLGTPDVGQHRAAVAVREDALGRQKAREALEADRGGTRGEGRATGVLPGGDGDAVLEERFMSQRSANPMLRRRRDSNPR